jgi:hypothetical protein
MMIFFVQCEYKYACFNFETTEQIQMEFDIREVYTKT